MNAAIDTAVQDFFDWQDTARPRPLSPATEQRNHERLRGRLHACLREHLRGLPARAWAPGAAVCVDPQGTIVHPDLAVSADTTDLCAGLPLRAPSLLIEIATTATAADDRGAGLERACRIASLREYVVIDAGCVSIEVFRRGADGGWQPDVYGPGAVLMLTSIDGGFDIDALYAGTTLR